MFINREIQLRYSGFALTVSASLIVAFFVAQMLVPMLLVQWARGKITVKHHNVKGGEASYSKKIYGRIMRWN